MQNRLYFLDRVRVWSVYAVVLLHAAMTYMTDAPAWWYVQDAQRSSFFLFLVLLLDIFPMSALYFVAGYCTPPSWNRRGALSFYRGKGWRIALPWLAGVVLVAPLFASLTLRALGYPIGNPVSFYTTVFLGPAYQQGHYWFLGVLLAFYLLYAPLSSLFSQQNKEGRFSWPMVIACWAGSVALYVLVGQQQPEIDSWLNVGFVLYFQSLRVGGYLLLYFLGAYAWKNSWFQKDPPHGHVLFVGVLSALLLGATLYLRLLLGGHLVGGSLLLYAAVHQGAAVTTVFALLLGCRLWGNEESSLLEVTSKASFGLYWVHMIVQTGIALLLVPLNWPAWVKFTLVVLLTLQVGERGTLIVQEKFLGKKSDVS